MLVWRSEHCWAHCGNVMKLIIFLLVLLGIRKICMLCMLRKRKKLTREVLMAVFHCGECGLEGIVLLAKMYALNQGYIRPCDSLNKDSFLTQYDSWSFNSGYNELEDFVEEKGSHVGEQWRVSDFIRWYEQLCAKG